MGWIKAKLLKDLQDKYGTLVATILVFDMIFKIT